MTDATPNRPTQPPRDPTYPVAPADAPGDLTPPNTPPATPPAALPETDADPARRTRTSNAWIGIIVFAVMLVLLLIFILQNTQSVEVSYFGANGRIPLAVAMLMAAVAGVLLTAIAGTLRIWQLRRHLRRANRQQ